ncbi:LAMI_0F08768g1_1 [Lachancea mirantina]|uniref:LAMI_0F08768g1_1 n=1 Tax=Lachancea mirantina TaxID=1230905 RepID=A0A1G4K0U0_9SACH|nr:LAMI_0F08768g1_1 [Lachancea mirantina]
METSKQGHLIPPFYCCYLLQSIPKRQSFYIGSTPNPVRRLRQHNGLVKHGSAYRTKKEGMRPWEMIVCVYGFTSKIVALQFEHAWQHGHSAHFIAKEDRIVKNKTGGRSIHQKIGNLMLLLKHPFFNNMGLNVQFFSVDAFAVWEQNKYRISPPVGETEVSNELEVDKTTDSFGDELSQRNLEHVNMLFSRVVRELEDYVEKCEGALKRGVLHCGICASKVNYIENDTVLVTFCPLENCNFFSHLQCLHRVFLDDILHDGASRALIPKNGNCPSCHHTLEWKTLTKIALILKEGQNSTK